MKCGRVIAASLLVLLVMPSQTATADHFEVDPDGHRNQFEGFLACSIGTPVYRAVGCDDPLWALGEPAEDDVHRFVIDVHPAGAVTIGLQWEATSDEAEYLFLSVHDNLCDCGVVSHTSGTSPHVIHLTYEMLNQTAAVPHEFAIEVYANQGIVRDQAFTVVTQEFAVGETVPEGYDVFSGPPA